MSNKNNVDKDRREENMYDQPLSLEIQPLSLDIEPPAEDSCKETAGIYSKHTLPITV